MLSPDVFWLRPEIFRLNNQSLCVVGYFSDAEAIRPDILRLAEEDGYEVHALLTGSPEDSNEQYRRLTALVVARLQVNPELRPWTGARTLFYDARAARGTVLSDAEREELGRMMRLTPYTGVAIGIESVVPRQPYRGVRMVSAEQEKRPDGWSDVEWKSRTIGDAPEEAVWSTL